MATAAGRTVLIVDGEPQDRGAIIEAVRSVEGEPGRLVVLLVPARVADWAHLELGDDPRSLRGEIELGQRRTVSNMLEAAGLHGGYTTGWLPSPWRVGALRKLLEEGDSLIVSTSRGFVRRRASQVARREGLPVCLAP